MAIPPTQTKAELAARLLSLDQKLPVKAPPPSSSASLVKAIPQKPPGKLAASTDVTEQGLAATQSPGQSKAALARAAESAVIQDGGKTGIVASKSATQTKAASVAGSGNKAAGAVPAQCQGSPEEAAYMREPATRIKAASVSGSGSKVGMPLPNQGVLPVSLSVPVKQPPRVPPKNAGVMEPPVLSGISHSDAPKYGMPPLCSHPRGTPGADMLLAMPPVIPLPLDFPPVSPLMPHLPTSCPLWAIPLPCSLPGVLGGGVTLPTMLLTGWETHTSPQGVPYYYCKQTGESRWVRPDGASDVVLPPGVPAEPPSSIAGPPLAPSTASAGSTTADLVKTQLGDPESWESIGRTSWLRVETEKGYKYFFNKKTKQTSWECPGEIAKEVAELDNVLTGKMEAPQAADEEAPPGATPDMEVREGRDQGKVEEDPEIAKPRLDKSELRQQQVEEAQKTKKENDKLKNFKQLLLEKGVKPFDKYEKWLPKLLHDKRFTAVPQSQRKGFFDALAKKIDVEKRKQTAEKKRGGREVFRELLAEAEKLGLLRNRNTSSAIRAMEKEFRNDDRWDALPDNEKERLIAEATEESTKRWKLAHDAALRDFRSLVMSTLCHRQGHPPPWHVMRRKLMDDPRSAKVGSSSDCEKQYEQVIRELEADHRKRVRRQREDEQEADAARKKRRLTEAEERLFNFLSERVKIPYGMDWDDAKEAIDDCDQVEDHGLQEEEQERIWEEYKKNAIEKKKKAFVLQLTHSSADMVGPDMEFETVLERMLDPADAKSYVGFPEDILREAWQEWREQAELHAIEVCKTWIKSCEHFRGSDGILVDGPEFQALIDQLSSDVRFKRLSHKPQEQRRLVANRLQELQELRERGRIGMEEEEAL